MSFLRSFGKKELDIKKLGIDDELLDLLYEIGILGLVRSYFVHAEAIFEGYKAVVPKSERARIGLGLLALARANYAKAIEVFRDELLEMNPESDFAKAYLGIAYKSSGKPQEAKICFESVIESNRDESLVILAKEALNKIKEESK